MAVMKLMTAIVVLTLGLILLSLSVAHAAEQSQAREVARLNNCPPKKIEVFQNSLGTEGKTIYRVQCVMPKAAGEEAQGPDTLLIACDSSLCEIVRPTKLESK